MSLKKKKIRSELIGRAKRAHLRALRVRARQRANERARARTLNELAWARKTAHERSGAHTPAHKANGCALRAHVS